jgi:hypothetical protein
MMEINPSAEFEPLIANDDTEVKLPVISSDVTTTDGSICDAPSLKSNIYSDAGNKMMHFFMNIKYCRYVL